MYYVTTATVVTDEVLFAPTGAFGRWARSIEAELQSAGFFHAPLNRRTNKTFGEPPVGSLKESIRSEIQTMTLRRFDIELSANTHYATYVHEGTNTIFVRGEGGRFGSAEGGMRLPANPGYGKARWRQRVSGQKANPFLHRAWNDVSRLHSSMGRFNLN